jgi:predicted SprT family Zn-dependent metalloprotease
MISQELQDLYEDLQNLKEKIRVLELKEKPKIIKQRLDISKRLMKKHYVSPKPKIQITPMTSAMKLNKKLKEMKKNAKKVKKTKKPIEVEKENINLEEENDRHDYAFITLSEEMNNHGLVNLGWSIGFNDYKTCAGITRFNKKIIELSDIFISNSCKLEIRDTILHEIAHALVGSKNNHNKVWKAKALEIGCSGNRCCNSFINKKDSKYILECDKGCEIGRHRMTTDMKESIGKGEMICKKHRSILKFSQKV